MRKIFGGFLGVIAALFLGLAYVQMATAADPDKKCTDELTKRILELVESDQSNILQKQFELATLKLAEVTADTRSATLEEYFRAQEDLIAKLDEKDVQEKLMSLYTLYGEAEDQAAVVQGYESRKTLLKNASYWKKETRFKNRDVSAFAYAHTFLHKAQSPFRPEDVAILWLQSEISEAVTEQTGRGSAPANMTEVSTLVARLSGKISGVAGKSIDEIKAAKKEVEGQIGAEFDRIVDKFRNELAEVCPELKKEGQVCADCRISEPNKIAAFGSAIAKVTEKLRTDKAARDAKVTKVIGEMEAQGYHVSLEQPLANGNENTNADPETDPSKQKVDPYFAAYFRLKMELFSEELKKKVEFEPFSLSQRPRSLFDLSRKTPQPAPSASAAPDSDLNTADLLDQIKSDTTLGKTDTLPTLKPIVIDTVAKANQFNDSLLTVKRLYADSLATKGPKDTATIKLGDDLAKLEKQKQDSLANPKTKVLFNPFNPLNLQVQADTSSTLNWHAFQYQDYNFTYDKPDTTKTKPAVDTLKVKPAVDTLKTKPSDTLRVVASDTAKLKENVLTSKKVDLLKKEETYRTNCKVTFNWMEENGKITILFAVKTKSGKSVCDGKAYTIDPNTVAHPKEWSEAEALKVCPELAKADSKVCEG